MRIAIELETPGDSRTMFRLLVDERLIAKEMTSAQAHVLVGDILERLALPKELRENDGQLGDLDWSQQWTALGLTPPAKTGSKIEGLRR
jgi:hypothetical protein